MGTLGGFSSHVHALLLSGRAGYPPFFVAHPHFACVPERFYIFLSSHVHMCMRAFTRAVFFVLYVCVHSFLCVCLWGLVVVDSAISALMTLRSIVLEELHRETQGQRLDFAALCRLHELHKCLKESVRLTAPVLMLRKVGPEGLELPESGGMFVPAGELVAVSPYVLHHRPDIYPRPFDWLPQRWDEDSDLVHPPASNMHFIGFGKGLHSCLGEAFAYLVSLHGRRSSWRFHGCLFSCLH